jgi:hypothetical protein
MTVPEKTHSGVLNRSKIESTGVEGTRGTKTDDCEATLRKGNLPKSSEVTTVDRDANKGKAIECAENQNQANVLTLKLSQEEATTAARKKVNKDDNALNSDAATHKG